MAGAHRAISVSRRDCSAGSDRFLYQLSLWDQSLELLHRTWLVPKESLAGETSHRRLAFHPACRSRRPTHHAERRSGPGSLKKARSLLQVLESNRNRCFAFKTPDQSSNAGVSSLPSASISFSRSITFDPDLEGKPMIVTLSPAFNVRRLHPC